MSIIDKGDDVFKKRDEIENLSNIRKERMAPRFWMLPDEKAIVVFLDSVPSGVWEHHLNLGGRWGNHLTCVKEDGNCPLCAKGDKSSYIAYFSAIDTREFSRPDGSKVKNRKVLFGVKRMQMKKFAEIMKRHNKDIRGKAFQISRYNKSESSSGVDYEYLRDVDLTKLEDTTPFDYDKVLAPYSVNDLLALGITVPVLDPAHPTHAAEEETTKVDDLFN